jgi:hypothetical protein
MQGAIDKLPKNKENPATLQKRSKLSLSALRNKFIRE